MAARLQRSQTACAQIERMAMSNSNALLSIETAWIMAVDLGDSRQTSGCALCFGLILIQLHLFELANRWLERARGIASADNHWLVEASAELNLIAVRVARENDLDRLGRTGIGEEWARIIRDIWVVLGRPNANELPEDVLAALRTNHAIALWRSGHFGEARALLEQQVRTFESSRKTDRFAASSFYLADMLLQLGEPRSSLSVTLSALSACDQQDVRPLGYGQLLELASMAAERLGDGVAALHYLRRKTQLEGAMAQARARDQATLLAIRLEAMKAIDGTTQ